MLLHNLLAANCSTLDAWCDEMSIVCVVCCSAVDNVLAKLAAEGVPLLRLGRPGTVHPALRGHLPGGVHFPDTSVAGLAAAAAGARVVRVL
jgi:hypothetical protein